MTDITPIVEAIITLLAAVITVFVIPYILSKRTSEKFDKFIKWVGIGVSAAEQIYEGLKRGVEKKQYVKDFLERRGYTYDSDIVNAAIESAVKQLNIEQGKTLNSGEDTDGV